MAPKVGFGIDFGTTNSVAAAVASDDGEAYPYLDAGFPHPSFVWYGKNGIRVGQDAKRNFNAFAELPGNRFIRSVKRELGHEKDYEIDGTRTPAWSVAAQIFKKIRESASSDPSAPADIRQAVVTIPIHFGGAARRELRRAAQEAGIEVLNFVHEPFAAVVGYYRSISTDLGSLENERILVFDWGGGTLDVTLARVGDGRIEEIATGGIGDIAGDHFDEAIRGWAMTRFLDQHKLPGETRIDLPTKDRIILESERRKIELSTAEHAILEVPRVVDHEGRPLDLEEPLARATFEALIEVDLQRALGEVDGVIAQARVTPGEIDRVLLIGGSSEIPRLRDEMARRFGVRAVSVRNSQTVIAEGAAAIAFHSYVPYLVHPIAMMLADDTWMTVLDAQNLLPMPQPVDQTLFCTDNRDGTARLIIGEQQHARDERTYRHHGVVAIPVTSALPKPYQHERIHAQYHVDQDLILHVTGYAVSRQEVARAEFHDLRFGLRVR